MAGRLRPVWAEVDLAAIRHNASLLADLARPAQLCVVLKAWGYGHGPLRTAEAAIAGGATWLAVALVEEGVDLRDREITEPVLVLSEPPLEAMRDVVERGLTPTLYTHAGIEAAAKAVAATGQHAPLAVHLKVDTGMHRVGAAPDDIAGLVDAVVARPELRLEGLWTHLANADEPDDPYTARQLARFEDVRTALAGRGIRPPMVHAANSAGAIAHPSSRYDLVRCGIAVYGLAPGPALEGSLDLRPAMSLKARVSYVRRLPAGEALSYGQRHRLDRDATIATVPIGYADGVPRRLGDTGGEVLIGGRRRPIAGAVTMDQLMADCGDDEVAAGDEVVLLGVQGDDRIGAEDWAARLGTISYEIVCGIGRRVAATTCDHRVITDVAGVRVGHWTNEAARTGCTVVLFPDGTVASGEVRGGAPATREWALLEPHRTVSHLDAVLLAGGSAFGLAAADGVVRFCEERGIGFPTAGGPVPIVVAAALFDLTVGDGAVRPGPDEGYAACVAARAGTTDVGPVGAGAGATVGKWRGREQARPAGVGSASARAGDLLVGVIVAVNAWGDVGAVEGPDPETWPGRPADAYATAAPESTTIGASGESTTIGVVATNAALDKLGCLVVAQAAHDGLSRAVFPAHSTVDGDAFVAASVGGVDAPVDQVRVLATRAVEAAVLGAAGARAAR